MSESHTTLHWTGEGLQFRGDGPGEVSVLIDGDGKASPSPMYMLLHSVAACAAVDVVEILTKMRIRPEALRVEVRAERAQGEAARPWKRIVQHFYIKGEIDRSKAERAVALSVEKYCSVGAMLRHEAEISWELTIES